MRILFTASEAVPFCKTGGLADVAGSLPQALAKAGNEVAVVLPLYQRVSERWKDQMTFITHIEVPLGWRRLYCGLFRLDRDGVITVFSGRPAAHDTASSNAAPYSFSNSASGAWVWRAQSTEVRGRAGAGDAARRFFSPDAPPAPVTYTFGGYAHSFRLRTLPGVTYTPAQVFYLRKCWSGPIQGDFFVYETVQCVRNRRVCT